MPDVEYIVVLSIKSADIKSFWERINPFLERATNTFGMIEIKKIEKVESSK